MMKKQASQLIRAIRGPRSQVGFARRLGYRGNPIPNWENGRRYPTAVETLRAAALSGIDVAAAFRDFATPDAPAPTRFDTPGLAAWLDTLRGQRPISGVAAALGVSRPVASRWFSGTTRPRLPQFLHLLSVLTQRLSDWVAALVDIEQVPSLVADHRRRSAARRLAADVPWSAAVVRLLETEGYAALPAHRPGWIARRLSIDATTEAEALTALEGAGAIRWDGTRYRAVPQTVATRPSPDTVVRLKGHWAEVARARLGALRPGDLHSYNVISVSRADLEQIRQRHLAYFRDLRALVAASEPVEVAALVNVQLVTFDVPP